MSQSSTASLLFPSSSSSFTLLRAQKTRNNCRGFFSHGQHDLEKDGKKVTRTFNKRANQNFPIKAVNKDVKKFVEKASGLVKRVLCFDAFPSNDWIQTVKNAEYVDLDFLLENSNIISIHVPLLKDTHHLINKASIDKMKRMEISNSSVKT